MKIVGKKDIHAERVKARQVVDFVFIPRITEAMGPKFALYQAKAIMAKTNLGEAFLSPSDDRKDIIDRFNALSQRVATIEAERQDTQARIDNAITVAEIEKILKEI